MSHVASLTRCGAGVNPSTAHLRNTTEVTTDTPFGFLVGSHDGVIGILVFAWLSVLTLIYWLKIRRKQDHQL